MHQAVGMLQKGRHGELFRLYEAAQRLDFSGIVVNEPVVLFSPSGRILKEPEERNRQGGQDNATKQCARFEERVGKWHIRRTSIDWN